MLEITKEGQIWLQLGRFYITRYSKQEYTTGNSIGGRKKYI